MFKVVPPTRLLNHLTFNNFKNANNFTSKFIKTCFGQGKVFCYRAFTMSSQEPSITLYTAQTPNGMKISILLEELG